MRRRSFLLGSAGAAFAALAAGRVTADAPKLRHFPGWVYMPWTYQWTIGYTKKSGEWCREHGINGAFLDGNSGTPDSPPGKLDWINRFHLPFYLDHTAGKGDLHLWDGDQEKTHLTALHGNGVRPVPINSALKTKLFARIENNIAQVKNSPWRAAYALDDEASWGHFVHPTMWQITDDAIAYANWLKTVYGVAAPERGTWVTYDDVRTKLGTWSVGDFDASPLMDQWSFNDSHWCDFLGELVTHANTLDPQTPCGIVGAQSPSPFGGYDYAKLLPKIQFIEAYNLGSSQAIIRSLGPKIPAVTTHFHQSVADDIWQVWYYLAHGNQGHIGWVENWFDEETVSQPWLAEVAPHWREAGEKIGPLLQNAAWKHDGVAIYYSHPSIQLGWILDAQAHGPTWTNRNGDHRLGASHRVRQAWENMLRDAGLQHNFLSYLDVREKGVPPAYRVLILPACLCLSDAEARQITAFVQQGGTVIADYLPGVWDENGRGRSGGGALDILFGVRHDAALKSTDVFGTDALWCEVDQDRHYDWKSYRTMLTEGSTCVQDPSGFYKAVRDLPVATTRRVGAGTAVLMNLSPQWYNAYRVDGVAMAKKRDVFLRHVGSREKPLRRWVEIENADEPTFGYEITYFTKPDGRTVLFVCQNPEVVGTELGGGNAARLKTGSVPITLRFARPVHDLRDERQGKTHGDGTTFTFSWPRNEALVLSLSV